MRHPTFAPSIVPLLRSKSLRGTCLLLIWLMASGCMTNQPVDSPLAMPAAFSLSGSDAVPHRWWRVFGDPQLNQYIERALDSNFTLESVWQRLQAARALADQEAAAQYPDLDGLFETAFRQDEMELQENYSLGLAAEYELDLWGRIRSQVEAARFRSRATLFEYQAAALTLSAEVAATWFELLEADLQRQLLLEQVEVNEKIVRSLKARFGGGLIRSADILRQQQLVEATQEQVILVEAAIGVLQHQLAVLQGLAPQRGVSYRGDRLPDLPPPPRAGLPAELVQRRPDVRQAYFLVKAANRELAAAISNQFPRITLTASLVSAASNPSDLFGEWIRSMTGSIVAPLIDGGARRAEVRRTEAVEAERFALYGDTILLAFQEVEDAWLLERKERERIANLERQVALAQRTYQRLQLEYFNGVSEYLDVLTALIEAQGLQRDLLEARGNLLEFRVALYRALAGGFETRREIEARTRQQREQQEFKAWLKIKQLDPPAKKR